MRGLNLKVVMLLLSSSSRSPHSRGQSGQLDLACCRLSGPQCSLDIDEGDDEGEVDHNGDDDDDDDNGDDDDDNTTMRMMITCEGKPSLTRPSPMGDRRVDPARDHHAGHHHYRHRHHGNDGMFICL